MPAFVRYFMLVQWMNEEQTVDRLAKVNIPNMSQQNEGEVEKDNLAFGSKVYRFDPGTDIHEDNDRWIDVSDIVRPVILIKSKPPRPVWRLVQFQGKLLGSFVDGDDDDDV